LDGFRRVYDGLDGGYARPIPLGLGTFETACVGMLALLGVAIESALTATLLLRGLTFWLPMVPGLWLARREIGQ
jgi:glycosyltransferase 2 family protein